MEYEQDNVVDMLREYRNRRYEETKHMTREEKRAYDKKRYEESEKWFASVKPNPDRFPFLPKK